VHTYVFYFFPIYWQVLNVQWMKITKQLQKMSSEHWTAFCCLSIVVYFKSDNLKEKNIKRCSWFWGSTLFYVFLLIFTYSQKKIWHKIFNFCFFHELVFLGPLNIPLMSFQILRKFATLRLLPVNQHRWLIIASVVDTGDYALSQIFNDSMTPAIKFSPVTTTPAIHVKYPGH
jgi:hypothetical protein